MTDLKLDAKLTTGATEALADHARALYDRLGTRVGIVELRAVERVTPAPAEDKAPAVKLRISALEVAGPDLEGAVREAQRALYLQRTAQGTLTEQGEIEMSKETIRLAAGTLHAIETGRLRAAVDYWAREARKVVHSSAKLRDGEIRHELDRIAAGLDKALHPARVDDDTTDD